MNFETLIIKGEKGDKNNPYSGNEYYEDCRKQMEKNGFVKFRGYIDFTDKYEDEIDNYKKYGNKEKTPNYIKIANKKIKNGNNVFYYDVVRRDDNEINSGITESGHRKVGASIFKKDKYLYLSLRLSEFDREKEHKDNLIKTLKFKLDVDLNDKIRAEIVKMAYDKLSLSFAGLINGDIFEKDLIRDIEENSKKIIEVEDKYLGQANSKKFNLK
jgi:virulence-associated protein VapD